MNACVYTVLLACIVATAFAQGCYNDAVKTTHKECGGKVKNDKPADEAQENELMFNCVMCKTGVVAEDKMDFDKFNKIVDENIVEGKREDIKKAVNECKAKYEEATEKKVKAFNDCYLPQLQTLCGLLKAE